MAIVNSATTGDLVTWTKEWGESYANRSSGLVVLVLTTILLGLAAFSTLLWGALQRDFVSLFVGTVCAVLTCTGIICLVHLGRYCNAARDALNGNLDELKERALLWDAQHMYQSAKTELAASDHTEA